ncbi:hypothetical protein L1987_60999 [Smallanthus sonchifolius]|uniref:Uncharacterized protein n=1 Tax=Smallanthus sonchifolius TaxID=185202 RepID=A0ACB9D9Z9_9ASTR|nr:hypothetical protein L1987_60999 [Smallanthus sonchifolius]
MGTVRATISDGVLTFMWVLCASTLGAATSVIATAVGVNGTTPLLITTALVFMLLLICGVIGDALGGTSFNPTGTAAFYVAGLGRDTIISAVVRFPAHGVGDDQLKGRVWPFGRLAGQWATFEGCNRGLRDVKGRLMAVIVKVFAYRQNKKLTADLIPGISDSLINKKYFSNHIVTSSSL